MVMPLEVSKTLNQEVYHSGAVSLRTATD